MGKMGKLVKQAWNKLADPHYKSKMQRKAKADLKAASGGK